jgi:hypothetical protein
VDLGSGDESEEDHVQECPESEHHDEDDWHGEKRVDTPGSEYEEGDVAADHEQLTVRHIQHLENSEGEGETKGDQPVHAPNQQRRPRFAGSVDS